MNALSSPRFSLFMAVADRTLFIDIDRFDIEIW